MKIEAVPGIELFRDSKESLRLVGLEWKDLEKKKVLDVGAGEARLAQAAEYIGSPAKIFSLDMERRENWSDLSSDLKQQTVEAAAKGLPFPDNYFDLIVNIGSVYAYAIADEARVLKPGGEIRVSGFGGQALDMWYVAYYLQAYEGMPYEQVEKKLSGFEQAIEDNDGWRPNEYAALEEKSIETLTFEEKKIVIEALVARYEEVAGVPMEIRITDSESPEPKGYIVHKKLA